MIAREIPRAEVRTVRETTSDRMRRLRLARGWTQARLAREAGVKTLTVWRAEQGGEIFASTLDSLAGALRVSMHYLWRGEEGPA